MRYYKDYVSNLLQRVVSFQFLDKSWPMRNNTDKVLVIEEDTTLRHEIKDNLDQNGYLTLDAPNATTALRILRRHNVHVILLGHNLPDGKWLELIPAIRNHSDAPIVIVGVKNDTIDNILGLELGADDYIGKPMDMREVAARVKANVRRYKDHVLKVNPASSETPCRIRFGKWVMDCSRYQIFDEEGRSGDLTVKEFKLLEVMVRAPGRTFSREQLFTLVRDRNSCATDRAVDVQITRIRQKICEEAALIRTVRGIGYVFEGTTRILPADTRPGA